MGRHSVVTPEILNKLEQAYSNNATDVQACFYAGISKSTLYNYQNEHPEFVERKEALKANLGLIAKNTVGKAIKDGDAKSATWYLERTEKNEFSTKLEQVTEGTQKIILEMAWQPKPEQSE